MIRSPQSFLTDYQQGHQWNDIEEQQEYFEQAEERVHDHVERLPGDGKPGALRTVHQVRGRQQHDNPEEKQGAVYDCAPHKESCQSLYIHDVPPFVFIFNDRL